jgi:peptidyl-prolyl cis-trans isomerase A (cyclophilin A)
MNFINRRHAALALALGVALGAGTARAEDAPKVKFATTAGDIVVEVYPDKAPKTVENFLQYVRDKHYNGTVFHRVIDNFMIQGGGFDASYVEKPTRAPVQHEGQDALAKGGPKNLAGTIAMARTSEPHSASSQFFINVKDNPNLDPVVIPPGNPVARFEFKGRVYENVPRSQLAGNPQLYGYTVFGKVVSGMDVVNKIKGVGTGPAGPFSSDVPRQPIVITSATLVNSK